MSQQQKPKENNGPGPDQEQTSMFEGQAEAPGEDVEIEGASETIPDDTRVVEIANTGEGCWKLLANGDRIELSEAEWPTELARLFGRKSAGA